MDPKSLEKFRKKLLRLQGAKPLAIVFGSSVNGLSFVRSLGRRGVPTLLLDSDKQLGFYSGYGLKLLLPDVDKQPEEWLEFLEFIGSQMTEPGVLFTTSDVHTFFVSRYEEFLKKFYRFLVPEIRSLECIIDKRTQYMKALSAGVPIPKSFYPNRVEELRDIRPKLEFPCILKPCNTYVGRKIIIKKVLVLEDYDELVREFSRVTATGASFLIQEIVPGQVADLYTYLAFWDKDAREHSWLTKRKLRQHPLEFGDGSLQITEDVPEVRNLSLRLLQEFGFKGFVGVEFIRDERDGVFRLMEINPRTELANQLAIAAGLDFPWIGYRYLLQENGFSHPTKFESGVKFLNEHMDLHAFLSMRKKGSLKFIPWLRSLKGIKGWAIWSCHDPKPFFVMFYRMIKGLFFGKKFS